MKLDDAFDELQKCQDDVPILRKLISNFSSRNPWAIGNVKTCQTILAYIIPIISSNSELGNERILIASHAFYALLSTHDLQCLEDTVTYFQKLDSDELHFLERRYTVSDLELFKLFNAYGYLQAIQNGARFEYDALLLMFETIYKNCMVYTRYSYFAYKVLHAWLKKLEQTSDTLYWRENNCIVERKLEAIIFSNWSNALNDIRKQNAQIFNIYLRIMSQKYKGVSQDKHKRRFMERMFRDFKYIPVRNEIKYIIMTEIYQVSDTVHNILINDDCHLFRLCFSLMKSSLRSGGTKMYLAFVRKLSEAEWKKLFGNVIFSIIVTWESRENENHDALRSLFKYWLEPTIEMHRNILPFLWKLCDDSPGYFLRSHLLKTAAKLRIELPGTHDIDYYINDKEEIVRLNAFAVLCYRVVYLIDIENDMNPFCRIKQFLCFNANATTIFMREEIMKYFKILCSNILKVIINEDAKVQSIFEFIEWLYEYFVDCFDIGSCYQRKILALNLYKILLSFTNGGNSHENCARHKECLRHVMIINKYLKSTKSWKFTDKESLFLLLRLVLDSAIDVRQLATTLILEYFEKDILSVTEKHILYNCAWKHCNSSKFYKIESGAALVKIMAYWLPLNEIHKDTVSTFSHNENNIVYSSYSELLLYEARCQLAQMKSDILKTITENRPFYGALTALLSIAFRGGPENRILTSLFTEEILNVLKDAVDFFISTLSTQASDTVYSSSFAEMGLAIDEKIKISEIKTSTNYDELQLSPAHQVLISCIWMSLKLSCEIVSEVGMLMHSNTQVKCSMDIITTVLMKCRHKGVVESAGVAIANLARCLYNQKEYCELPKAYLASLLEDAGKSLHLTRRGAGLSIMFHRLVISDNRRDRPMVHFAVQMLLSSLKDFSMTAVREIEPGRDPPWVKHLYFLRTLIADKEIHAQLVRYMEDICLTCFDYMKSDVWTVRNASLQLYGAVVPRLVGQCSERSSDEELDFGRGYSVNHFVTHYPRLTSHLWTQLRDVSRIHGTSNAALRSYSSIVHILVLLSKLSIGNSDLVDYPGAIVFVTRIQRLLLISFLSNPMIYIRQLAAKVYTAFSPTRNMYCHLSAIKKAICLSRDVNMSHGYLLAYGYLRKKFNDVSLSIPWSNSLRYVSNWQPSRRYISIANVWDRMSKHQRVTQPCYMLETMFLQQDYYASYCFSQCNMCSIDELIFRSSLKKIECNMSSLKIQPGFFQFVEQWARMFALHYIKKSCIKLERASLESMRETIRNILDSNCTEQSIEFLNGLSHCVPLLEFILEYLLSMNNDRHQLLFNEIVSFALNTIKSARSESNNELEGIIEEFNRTTDLRKIRVRNSLILAFSKNETLISQVLSCVFDACMNETQSVRLTAVEHVELALHRQAELGNHNKLILMRCCLILLKDEIAEIREIVSIAWQRNVALREYVVNSASRGLQHEEIFYQRLLSDVIRLESIVDDGVDFVQYFTRAIDKDIDFNATIKNPFNHDDSTFYREESTFLNMCYFLYDASSDNRDASCTIQVRHFRKLREKAGFNCNDLVVVLYLKEIDYLARKRNVVRQRKLLSIPSALSI